MPEQVIKKFLEQFIEAVDNLSEALRILLHYYYCKSNDEENQK